MFVEALPPAPPAPHRRRVKARFVCLAILSSICPVIASAQLVSHLAPQFIHNAEIDSLPDAPLPQLSSSGAANTTPPVTLRRTPTNILKDQATIWTSPAHLREGDLKWIVPLGLATTVAITADHQVMSSKVSHDAKFNHDNVLASDAFTGVLVAVPVGLIGKGVVGHDDDAKESGVLSGEAMVDGAVVQEVMKLIFLRERPDVDNAKGKFFQTSAGTDGSFPSSHCVISWSSAAVLAEEYPDWWKQAGIYMMATGVSITRVLGQEHFPSDALVGSAVGWMIGHYVHRKRHHKERVTPYD